MQQSEIQLLVQEIAENFGVQIKQIIFRQKESLISIRKKNQQIFFSLSNACLNESKERLYALVFVMLAKYTQTTHCPLFDHYMQILQDINRIPQLETAPPLHEKKSHFFDLELIMQELIAQFSFVFGDVFHHYPPVISWMARKTFRKFGVYRKINHSIQIAKILDSPEIPAYAVKYVIYHELLHAMLGIKRVEKRSIAHDAEFHSMERLYPECEEAEIFMKQYSEHLRQLTQCQQNHNY